MTTLTDWESVLSANPTAKLRASDIIYAERQGSPNTDVAGVWGTVSGRYTAIFVNNNGDDTNGNGSSMCPYQTVQGAMTGIAARADSSISKQYVICMQGAITDTEVSLLPWVHLFSDGSPWYVPLIILSTSLNSAVNIGSHYKNLSFAVNCNLDLTFTDTGSSSGSLFFDNCNATKIGSSPTPTINFFVSSPNNAHKFNFNDCAWGNQDDGNNVSITVPMGGCAPIYVTGGILPNLIDFSNTTTVGNFSRVSLANCSVPNSTLKFNQASVYLDNMSVLFNAIAAVTVASNVSINYDNSNYLNVLTQTGSGNDFKLIQKSYPPSFVEGLELTWTGFTTLNVGNGSCIDSTNNFILNDDNNSYGIDISTNGAGGLDTGSPAAGLIYIYKIWKSSDPTSPNVVASTNNAAPNFSFDPTYNLFRRVGYWVVNSGFQLDALEVTGNSNQRTYYVASSDPAFTVLSGGSATTATTVDCSAVVPGYAEVSFTDNMNPGAIANTGYNLVGTSFAAAYFRRVSNVATVAQTNSTGFVPTDNSAHINYLWDSTSTGRSLTLTVNKIREYI